MNSTSFPERLVLAPHRSLLSRGSAVRQFGLDPRGSVTVEGLPPEVLPLIEGLRAPAVSVEWIGRAAERGVPADYSVALLAGLVDRGVLVDASVAERRRARRQVARVEVRGDGPLAAAVAVGLARAGVGGVHVVARGRVTPGELGCGGYASSAVGRERAEAAAAAVVGLGLGTDTAAGPPGRRTDLVVLADAVVGDPADAAALQAEGVDHLPVLVRDGVGVVGPLVMVGRSPCLRCVELGRTERDPGWPGVAAQLTGRSGSAEPETVAATAALGVAQSLVLLDGEARPPSLSAAMELDPHAGVLLRRRWSGHPRCPCGWTAPGRSATAGRRSGPGSPADGPAPAGQRSAARSARLRV